MRAMFIYTLHSFLFEFYPIDIYIYISRGDDAHFERIRTFPKRFEFASFASDFSRGNRS